MLKGTKMVVYNEHEPDGAPSHCSYVKDHMAGTSEQRRCWKLTNLYLTWEAYQALKELPNLGVTFDLRATCKEHADLAALWLE